MSIPVLPPFYDMPYIQDSSRLTAEAYLYNDNLWQSLNAAVTIINTLVTSGYVSAGGSPGIVNNGLVAPSKTTAEITALEANAQTGTIWFNTTLAKLQVKTASGTIETITSV